MWQDFEQKIRSIASFRWNCNAVAEEIAGVQCDCVLKLSWDEWIVVEITEERRLEKVRNDILKLWTVKSSLLSQGILCRCFFVMKGKPTDAMRSTGDAQKIHVMSGEEFQNEYFEYSSYLYVRKQRPFGSLINLETGNPENNVYTEVSYLDKRTGKKLRISDIIELLKKGKKIILKGDFGLGKSRCVKQIFDELTADSMHNPYTIAINLREHWGAKRATEILTRHFDELGLDSRNFIKSFNQENIIYLLDGFDEIGTQSWSSDIKKMQHMREVSVCALKDLIGKVQGGILLTGREYYFNSDQEMFSCLGLDAGRTTLLECPQEFTDSELLAFISQNIPNSVNKKEIGELPVWLPKRPLVMQLLLKYAEDVFSIDYALDDICGFWYALLTRICEREAKIYPALNPEIIKSVLLNLANQTCCSVGDTGPITQDDLSNAFLASAGFSPNDESSIMLQRLPSIGRISADSPDRQFLDSFILNGLRAENIIQLSKSWDDRVLSASWKNPLDEVGLSILSEYINKEPKRIDTFLAIARNASNSANKVLAANIVAAICLLNISSLDFKDIHISDAHFRSLSFEGKEIQKLSISDTIIEKLDLTNSKLCDSVKISKCMISTVYGIASSKSVPSQVADCSVENCEMLATTTLIKKARLSESQKLFVEMLRKIFFQPGSGRMEAALLRGMGMSANKQLGGKILRKLLDAGLITRFKGKEGNVYSPVRSETARVDKILTDLTLSQDPLWQSISLLS